MFVVSSTLIIGSLSEVLTGGALSSRGRSDSAKRAAVRRTATVVGDLCVYITMLAGAGCKVAVHCAGD